MTYSLQRLLLNMLPGKKIIKRALLAMLQRVRSQQKLKAAIDSLPRIIASSSAVASLRNARLVKDTSSGRDLVISCGNTVHEWNPEMLQAKGKGFIGGSEEAVINLSRELTKLGWKVTVYNNCGNKPITDLVTCSDRNGVTAHQTVTYRPFWERNFRDKQDVVILWRFPRPLDTPINATKILLDLHDTVAAEEFSRGRLKSLTKILVKSQFHRSLYPNVPDNKIAVIPNGIDLSLLESNPPIERDPYLIINTSSPERSMDVMPKLFKEVKRRVPQAKLQWAYGWDTYKSARYEDKRQATAQRRWMKQAQKEIDEAGIDTLGRLTHAEVGTLYQRASILAYPTEFAEIDCISVRKAQAAGCLPVITDFGALVESTPFAWKIHSTKTKDTWRHSCQIHFGLEDEQLQNEWVDLCVKALRTRGGTDEISGEDRRHWSRQFEWKQIATKWNQILTY